MANSLKTIRAGAGYIAAITASGCIVLLTACTSPPPRPLLPDSGAAKFTSLVEFSVDSSGREHVIELTAPTPGYQAQVVYIGEAYKEREVYLLIREPDPLYIYSAVLVKQRILTGVDSTMPIRILAEQLPFSAKPDPDLYLDVMRSPGRVAVPAATKTATPAATAPTPPAAPVTPTAPAEPTPTTPKAEPAPK